MAEEAAVLREAFDKMEMAFTARNVEARKLRAELEVAQAENARLRGLLHMHRVGTGHAAYADPLHGGWDGYEAACWDCEWRSGNVYTDDGGKERAQAEASAHRESFDAALSECASKDPQ